MANIGYATLRVVPSFGGFQKHVDTELNGAQRTLQTRMSAAGTTAGHDSGKNFASGFTSRLKDLGGLAFKGLAIGAAIGTVAATKFGFESASMFEQARVSFDALTGSVEKGGKTLNELAQFAAKTPFEIPGVLDASRQLLGVGIAAEDIIPAMTKIGDVASVLGQPGIAIERAVRALGQIKGKGKLQAEEMRQITEALPGFSTIGAVAEAMGISTSAAFKEIEKGAVPADFAIKAILDGMAKFPGAAGAMERQSKTLAGTLSLLKDTLRISLAEGLQPVLPELTKTIRAAAPAIGSLLAGVSVAVAGVATNLLGPLTTALAAVGPALAPFLSSLGSGVGKIITALTPSLVALAPVIGKLGPIFAQLGNAIAPIAAALGQIGVVVAKTVVAAIEALTPAFSAIFKALKPLLPIFVDLAKSISGALVASLTNLAPALAEVARTLGGALVDAVETLAPVLPELVTTLGEVAVILVEGLAVGLTALRPALPALAELIRLAALLIASVPPQLLAGIVAGFLAFKGISAAASGVASLSKSFDTLSKNIVKFTAGDPSVNMFAGLKANTGKIRESLRIAGNAILDFGKDAYNRVTNDAERFGKVVGRAGTALLDYGKKSVKAAADAIRLGVAWTALNVRAIAFLAAQKAQALWQGIVTAATHAWTAAQWLLNVALTANPIGVIVVGIAALVAAVILAYQNIDIFRETVDAVVGFIIDNWPIALALLTGGMSVVAGLIVQHWNTIRSVVEASINFVASVIRAVVNGIVAFWTFQWNGLTAVVQAIWSVIGGAVTAGVNAVRNIITGWFGAVTAAWSAFWRGLVAAVDILRDIVGAVQNIVADIAERMFEVGQDIVRGLGRGVRSLGNWFLDAIRDIILAPVRLARGLLRMGSPSKLWAEIGESIPQGMSLGIQDGSSEVTASLVAMFQANWAGITGELLNFEQLGGLMGDKVVVGFQKAAANIVGPIFSNLPNVGDTLTSVGEDVNLTGLTTTLTDQTKVVNDWLGGLVETMKAGAPQVSAEAAKLGVDSGGALLKAWQAADQPTRDAFELTLAGLEQTLAAAKQRSLAFIPAFGEAGVSMTTQLNKQFKDSINLSGISLEEVGLAATMIATNTTLTGAGFTKGKALTDEYKSALDFAGVSETVMADAAALVRLNEVLPDGHKILAGTTTEKFQQALDLAGAEEAQLVAAAEHMLREQRLGENAEYLAEQINFRFKEGTKLGEAMQEKIVDTVLAIEADTTLPTAGLVKSGQVTDKFREALGIEGVSNDKIAAATRIFHADRALPAGSGALSSNAHTAFLEALRLAGASEEEIAAAANIFRNPNATLDARNAAYTAGGGIGEYFGSGIVGGIGKKYLAVFNAGAALGNAAISGSRSILKEESPSKRARDEVGIPFVQGVVVGIEKAAPLAVNAIVAAMEALAKAATTGLPAAVNAMAGLGDEFHTAFVTPLSADRRRFAAYGADITGNLTTGIQSSGAEAVAALERVRDQLAETPRAITSVVGIDPVTPEELADMFGPAFAWINALPERITALLPNAGHWLDEKAADAIIGFVAGLEAQTPRFTGFFEALPDRVGDVPGRLTDVFRGTDLAPIGRGVADGFTGGLRVGFDDAVAVLGAVDLARPLASDLRPAGEATIGRFRQGLTDGLAAVRATLASTETFVVPPDLAPVGTRIMATLTAGLRQGAVAVRGALGDLSTLVGAAGFAFAEPPDPARIVRAITTISERLRSALADPLGLGGPSTVFSEYGRQVVDGLTEGLTAASGPAVAVLVGLAERFAEPLPPVEFSGVEAITVDQLEDRFVPAFDWIQGLPERVTALLPAGWLDLTPEVDRSADELRAAQPALAAAFADLPGRLTDAMLDGIRAGIDIVAEFVVSAFGAVTDPLVNTDMRAAGEGAMRRFQIGLDDIPLELALTVPPIVLPPVEPVPVTVIPNLDLGVLDPIGASLTVPPLAADLTAPDFEPLRAIIATLIPHFESMDRSLVALANLIDTGEGPPHLHSLAPDVDPGLAAAPGLSARDLLTLAELRVTQQVTETGASIGMNVEKIEVNGLDAVKAGPAILNDLEWRSHTKGNI